MGANTLSLPVPLPPGTAGFEPSLTLVYSSLQGDGPFGVGWGLEFGEIRRSLRNGTPAYHDAVDRFALGAHFRTFTETLARVRHLTGAQDSWEVTQPDGTILRYGVLARSPSTTRRCPTRASRSWTAPAATSRSVSARSRCGSARRPCGTSSSPTRGETGAGKTYSTGRSRLALAQTFGAGGTASLPAQRFEYASPADTIGTGSNGQAARVGLPGATLIGPNGEDRGVRFGDVDGDARADMLQAYQDSAGILTQRVYRNVGGGWVFSSAWSSALALNPTCLQTAGRKLNYAMQSSGGDLVLQSAICAAIAALTSVVQRAPSMAGGLNRIVVIEFGSAQVMFDALSPEGYIIDGTWYPMEKLDSRFF